tara:strand:+ start:4435 stop:5397 length:963 start_codon:yes stop_codon:yes gene_type:complete
MAETKLLSYVNGGYLDFALNWLKYIRELDMQDLVIMYCLDDESFERMSEEKDIECKRWISPNFHIETTSEFHQKGWDALMWNKMEAAHQLLTAGYTVLYADTDINFLKNPLSDLEKICEEGNYDVAFQVAGGASICPGFFYAKSNEKTIHLFNIDREDFKQGYIETNEDGEIKQRKFKEDMMLLNLRLHRAIEPDDINYVQLSANGYPQGVHWERNIKNRGRERAEQDAFIVHFNCTVGWSNIDEMTANGLQDFDYHQRKVWNMLRHDMWKGDVPEGMVVPDEIVEMKPGPLTEAYRAEKKARRGRRKPRGEGRRKRKQS